MLKDVESVLYLVKGKEDGILEARKQMLISGEVTSAEITNVTTIYGGTVDLLVTFYPITDEVKVGDRDET